MVTRCDQALAVVGSAAAVFEILLALAMGMATGLSITVARCCGNADGMRTRKTVAASLIIALAFAVILTVGTYILLHHLLRLLHTPEEVYSLAYNYLVPVILFMFVNMAYNLFAGFLRAAGNSIAPLIFLVISSCLNVGLDILFIVPLGMGVKAQPLQQLQHRQWLPSSASFIYSSGPDRSFPNEKTLFPTKQYTQVHSDEGCYTISGFRLHWIGCVLLSQSHSLTIS